MTLQYITLHYITMHYKTLQYITWHYITSHYNELHHITIHYMTWHYNALQNITIHYMTLHYITLQYITSHCNTIHYITLQYIHIYVFEAEESPLKGYRLTHWTKHAGLGSGFLVQLDASDSDPRRQGSSEFVERGLGPLYLMFGDTNMSIDITILY